MASDSLQETPLHSGASLLGLCLHVQGLDGPVAMAPIFHECPSGAGQIVLFTTGPLGPHPVCREQSGQWYTGLQQLRVEQKLC